MKIRCSIACSLAAASIATAQTPVTLKTAVQVSDAVFNRIAGVHELPDGHVLAIDQTDKQVWDVDPKARTRVLAGASGTGPLEYQQPFRLFASGQNTIIEDFGRRKFLVFSSAAKPSSLIVGDSV